MNHLLTLYIAEHDLNLHLITLAYDFDILGAGTCAQASKRRRAVDGPGPLPQFWRPGPGSRAHEL